MKRSEAPPPGWYPDPTGGVRLRWWDGTDWTDRYRPRPGLGELALARLAQEQEQRADATLRRTAQEHLARRRPAGPLDPERLIAEVQRVARAEVDRAADVFGRQTQRAVRDIQPLVTQYRNRARRRLRLALALLVLLAAAWIAFKIPLEISLMEWIGDRIDNLTG